MMNLLPVQLLTSSEAKIHSASKLNPEAAFWVMNWKIIGTLDWQIICI